MLRNRDLVGLRLPGTPASAPSSTSERSGLDVEVGRTTAEPTVRLGGSDSDRPALEVEAPVDVEKVEAELGQREHITITGSDGTTSTSRESGLGLELGDLALAPVVGIGDDSGLTIALPVTLDGVELGLGSRETSTTAPGDETPAPGEQEPIPAPTPGAPAPVTPSPGDEPGRDGDDRPSTGTTPGATAPGTTNPGTTPGSPDPGTTPGTNDPGTTPGTGTAPGDQPDATWPEGLLDALLRTVVGDLGRLVQDVVDELTDAGSFVTDPGTTPGTETPRPAEPAPGDGEEPGTGGTPPAEGPDCGCAEEPEALPEVDDTVGTVTETTRDVTETVDTVVETTTETVSDVVDTVTDVVDTGLGGSPPETGQDDGDC